MLGDVAGTEHSATKNPKTNMTMKRFIHRTLALAAVVLMISGAPARAQDSEVDQLRSSMKSMQEMINNLTTNLANANARLAELEKKTNTPLPDPAEQPAVAATTETVATPAPKADASKSDLADATTPIPYRDTINEDNIGAARPGNAPIDPTYEGFMPLFGTKTWVKLGGYAKLDAIADTTKVGNPNEFITSQIPVEGEANFGKGEHFTMQAKQTRLSLELRAPTPAGSLKIYYENDFFNSSTDPTMDYRLRHFYGQVANVLAGQTWSTFYDPDANPDTLDFEGPGSLSVLRQAQLRYTVPIIKDAMSVAFAAEQPKSDLSNLPSTADGRNIIPDFTTNWRWEGKPGHVQVSGVLRSLSFDNNAGPHESKLGWGGQIAGGLKTWGEDNLLANFVYGDGIGRYIQDLPSGSAGVADADVHLHPLTAWGGMISYRHQWNKRWRSTVTYSYVQLNNRAALGDFSYDHTHYAQANLIWAMNKNFYVGIEYLYGLKEARNGNSGDDQRIQIALQYKLVR